MQDRNLILLEKKLAKKTQAKKLFQRKIQMIDLEVKEK
jgi:hypothetical protein